MGKIFLTTCFGLDHDIVLLDQFCRHYISLGIRPENFLIVFNTSDRRHVNENIKTGIDILSKYNIEISDIWCTKYESKEKWQRVNILLNKFVQVDDWIVHPDADEFHEIPTSNYADLFKIFDKLGINAFQGILIDRLSESLTIPESKDLIDEDLFKIFPVCANLSSLLQTSGVKLMGYKGFMRANNGSGQIHENFKDIVFYSHGGNISLHETRIGEKYLGDKKYKDRDIKLENWTQQANGIMKEDVRLLVHHFKWHGRVIEKLSDRVETYAKLKRPQVIQSLNVLEYYRKNGKFLLE